MATCKSPLRITGLGIGPFFAALALIVALAAPRIQAQSPEGGIVAIGGSVTEIIYALDQQHRLVARDTTSTYPPEALALPDVGYMRALSPEGVLSVSPALIVSEEGAGPPEALTVLAQSSIPIVEVPGDYSRDGVRRRILAVGAALDVASAAQTLAAEVDAALARAETAAEAAAGRTPKRVLFILSTRNGRVLASGTNTAADGIIGLSGAVNAITAFEGYKPLTDEAIIAAAPDAILMMARLGDHAAANAELFAMPAIATTPAARSQTVIRIDGRLLLGFGPRTAEAIAALSGALYPVR